VDERSCRELGTIPYISRAAQGLVFWAELLTIRSVGGASRPGRPSLAMGWADVPECRLRVSGSV
jgi:hypothetical protein